MSTTLWLKQAIVTKYHGPTNHRGSRVSARCYAGRITVAVDYSLTSGEAHAAAMRALVEKLSVASGGDGWRGNWTGGHAADGSTVWTKGDNDSTVTV